MFNDFNMLDYVFFTLAAFSSFFFLLRVVMMFIGGIDAAGDGDIHGDMQADAHADFSSGHDAHGGDSDSLNAFHILSINSITAFIMIFGWIGLAAHRQFLLDEPVSVFFAFLAGLSAMFATAYIFRLAMNLTSTGSIFNINELVGRKGSVYQRIDAEKGGKIQICGPDNVTREVDAVTYDGTAIESFSNIEVVEVINSSTVSVVKI